jgi:enterochelin esterase family protein
MKPNRKLFQSLVVTACFLMLGARAYAQPVLNSPVVSPQVSPDRKVTVRLPAPDAKTVTVTGDFTRTAETPMTKDDKGVWSFTSPVLEPGVYGYFFKLDGVRVPDPGNLLISSGATFLKSYVEVNGDQPQFWSVRDVPHGTLHENLYKSPSLGTTRRIMVYTPPGYNESNKKDYPVLYLYHASGDNETFWFKVARANFIMDNLLADGKAKPALIVTCFGHTSVPPGPEEGGPGGLYDVNLIEKDLLENVIPLVEKEYRVSKQGKDRAIAGHSMGGYHAMTIGLNNPDKFGYVAGFSAGFRANQDLDANFKGLLADPKKSNEELQHVWVQVGADEGNGMIGPNRSVDAFLTSKGIKHDLVVIPGGWHSWMTWRGSLRDLLPQLFTDN